MILQRLKYYSKKGYLSLKNIKYYIIMRIIFSLLILGILLQVGMTQLNCGDAKRSSAETCDDGNTLSGDG